MALQRPDPSEHSELHRRYVDMVPGDDLLAALEAQARDTAALLAPLDEARAAHRYAPGKWSVKQVVGHMADTERVLAWRALALARGERAALPPFDQDAWMAAVDFDRRPLADLAAELALVRRTTLVLLRSLDAVALDRRGRAGDADATVRGLAWVIAGHERHHVQVLRTRYW